MASSRLFPACFGLPTTLPVEFAFGNTRGPIPKVLAAKETDFVLSGMTELRSMRIVEARAGHSRGFLVLPNSSGFKSGKLP